MEAEHNYDESNQSVVESRQAQRDRQAISQNNSGGVNNGDNPKATGRFRSIQTQGNGAPHMKG